MASAHFNDEGKHAFLKQAVKEQKRTVQVVVCKGEERGGQALTVTFQSTTMMTSCALVRRKKAADRMMQLAFVYSIEETDRDKYMIQLNKEINNCAGWPDWNRSIFWTRRR